MQIHCLQIGIFSITVTCASFIAGWVHFYCLLFGGQFKKGSFLREHRDDHNQLDLTFISLVVRKGADVISLVMYETGKGSQETVSNLLKRDGRTLFLINLFVLINL
jgi:hypothetical protein